MNRPEAIEQIEQGIAYLIMHHASTAACEQYSPSTTCDESDERIKEHQKWVVQLRHIRNQFEDLVTGLSIP